MPEPQPEFVHRFVAAPQPDSKLALLLLHGTGGTEADLLPVGRALAPGAALLSPRGKVMERGMPRFFRRIAEGVFDVDDLKFRAGELAAWVASARERYGLRDSRLVAAGYSNGANIAAAMLLLHPGLLSGAVLFRAMVPFEPDTPPDLTGIAVLLAAGTHDPIVPRENTARLAAMLRSFGAEVELHEHPSGHELDQDDVSAAKAWLERYRNSSTVRTGKWSEG